MRIRALLRLLSMDVRELMTRLSENVFGNEIVWTVRLRRRVTGLKG